MSYVVYKETVYINKKNMRESGTCFRSRTAKDLSKDPQVELYILDPVQMFCPNYDDIVEYIRPIVI